MVSTLDSGSSGPASSPSRGHCVCSWPRYLTLIVPLSIQVYKWVPETNAGGNPAMDLYSIQGGIKILPVTKCYRNQNKLRWYGPLGSMQI